MESRQIEQNLIELYQSLKKSGNKDLLTGNVPGIIVEMDKVSRSLLNTCKPVDLNSLILNKQYQVFKLNKKISRPINKSLFDLDLPEENSDLYLKNKLSHLERKDLARLIYTLSMSFCAVIDILRVGDKKSPATFFEKFIGNIFARGFNIAPTTTLEMLNDEILATDYIFKTDKGKSAIHLQVKLSTRERAIEAWAHQRIIDGIFGIDTYRGVLVVMSETNLKSKSMSVADVCVPKQWGIYQRYIAKLYRVYYLDVPPRTENLHLEDPHIQVKHLSEFFFESDRLLTKSVDQL